MRSGPAGNEPPKAKQPRYTPVPATGFKTRVSGFLAASLIKLYARTLRLRIHDQAGIRNQPPGVIWAFWHNRLLLVPTVYARLVRRTRPACVLTSPSGDGALLAAVMRRFGLDSVRGSSNKRAAQSLVECRRRLLSGCDLGITPDGPRGPVYVAAPGVVQLARLTGCPVMPVQVDYSRKWVLKSWDGFQIPRPFAKVTVTLCPVLAFGGGDSADERAQLEAMLSGGAAR